jgi:molecular chaperone GrpE
MDERSREGLIEEFRAFLDAVPEPAGEETPAADLLTLFTELAALKNEVRIEARQVKQAMDLARSTLDALQAQNDRLAQELAAQRNAVTQTRQEAERDLLLEVLELRDRLEAGLGHLGNLPTGWRERPRGATLNLLNAQREGAEIGLRRLDALLARYQVQPLDAAGERFDPHCMRVAALETHPDLPDGQVLEETRRGYRRGAETLRLGEVIVNKRASNP